MIKPIGEARLWIDLADEVIGLPILRDRYEPEMVALARALVGPGDVAVDVGAHIGFFTIHLASAVGPSGRVHAFEPLPRNADLLARSIAESRFADCVQLVRAAVADRPGEATLHFAAETLNTGGAFISERTGAAEGGLALLRVPTVRLDDLDLRAPVRLIKMDVEGAEPLVVAGRGGCSPPAGPTCCRRFTRSSWPGSPGRRRRRFSTTFAASATVPATSKPGAPAPTWTPRRSPP